MNTYFLDHGLKPARDIAGWTDNANMLIDVWENGTLASEFWKLREVNRQYVERAIHELGNEMVTMGNYQRRSLKGESVDYHGFVIRVYRCYLFIVGVELFVKMHQPAVE